jgi:hypothetical protein
LGRLLPVATASPCALFEAYNIGECLGWKGDFWGLRPDRKATGAMRLLSPSFRGARSASPESIGRHACGEMDSGLASPRNDDIRSFRVAAIRKNLVPGMMDSFFG